MSNRVFQLNNSTTPSICMIPCQPARRKEKRSDRNARSGICQRRARTRRVRALTAEYSQFRSGVFQVGWRAVANSRKLPFDPVRSSQALVTLKQPGGYSSRSDRSNAVRAMRDCMTLIRTHDFREEERVRERGGCGREREKRKKE